MASVTVALTGYSSAGGNIRWGDDVSLGSTFDLNGAVQTLTQAQLFYTISGNTPAGSVELSLVALNDRFTAAFEATGRIILESSDGDMLEVVIANADMSEPYRWLPSNSAEVIAFANHVRNDLTDQTATLTLTDDPATVAPAFADDTGNPQSWRVGTAIAPITVPEATGIPTPTYAVVGTIPSGFSFNAITRAISGTPTATGSGTIRIRASNSEGSDDWTVGYTTQAALVPPAFAEDTGNAQSWITGQAINPIPVSLATGNPTPTYAPVGTPPTGIAFNAESLVISGIPTVAGSGTISIRATNSEGSDDWTVDYTISEGLAMSARAGNPTATFNATAIPPPPTLQLAMEAMAGNPTASFNLRAVPPPSPIPWVQDLDPDRWAWTWAGYLPRQILVDAYAEALGARQGARFNDYQNLHPSALPFRAFDLDAILWEPGATIAAQRNALARAEELNRLIGTEEAYYILLEVNRCTGYHRYRPTNAKPNAAYTGVECYITAPIDRAFDPDFLLYITDRVRRVWPFTLEVIAVHIITVSEGNIYIQTAQYSKVFSGWPGGV